MQARRYAETVLVACPADEIYDLVADVTRTGEWSPICQACWWDDPAAGAVVGARFTGRNVTPSRIWKTRSEVVVADRGREFAWEVAGGWVRWSYRMAPADGAAAAATALTALTESWEFTEAGLAGFVAKYGDDAPAQIEERTAAAHDGIPATLSAIARIATR